MRRALLGCVAVMVTATPMRAQIVRGLAEVATDTVRHGVFLETAGVGGLFALSYEHHFGRVITQVGFTKWSIQLWPHGVKSANTAAIGSVFREIPIDWLFDRTSFEVGGGLAGGHHARDAWAQSAALDSLPRDPPEMVVKIRGAYVAMTGLAGFRFRPEIAHDLTLRVGWVPIVRLRDQPGASPDARGTIALSAGFTW